MDKTPPQLDPKLKEAYDRVMGTVITPPSNPAETTAPPLQPTQPQPIASSPVQAEQTHISTTATVVEPQKVAAKKKRKISPIFIVLGIIVFLVIYAVVWVKFFGLSIPFLNP